MHRYGYTKQQLCLYVKHLATAPGDVRERLWQGFIHYGLRLTETDFPAEGYNEWLWICNQFEKKEPVYGHGETVRIGNAENSMKYIRRSTGTKIAEKIVGLYFRMLEE